MAVPAEQAAVPNEPAAVKKATRQCNCRRDVRPRSERPSNRRPNSPPRLSGRPNAFRCHPTREEPATPNVNNLPPPPAQRLPRNLVPLRVNRRSTPVLHARACDNHETPAQSESNARRWPDPWKMAVIAICTLILCSCRSPAGPCRATPHWPAGRRFVAGRSLHGRHGRRRGCRADGAAGHGARSAHALRGRADRGRRPASASPGPKTSTSATAATKATPPVPAKTAKSWALTWKTRWPSTKRSTIAKSSNRATKSTSTALASARCGKWSVWWPTKSVKRRAASTIRCNPRRRPRRNWWATRSRTCNWTTKSAPGPPRPCGRSRATASCRARFAPRRSKTPSNLTKTCRSSAWASSTRPRWRSSPAARTRPSPGRTPRPCKSSSIARPRWPT